MTIALTVLIIIVFLFFLYYFIKVLSSRKDIVYFGEKDRALVYREGDMKLIGRPDYIKKQENNYIPYEYKTLKIKSKDAYLDHKLQLACYMRLIEKSFGKKPNYGMIVYGNKKSFKVDNTLGLQKKLDRRINRLKKLKTNRAEPVRNHNIFNKCFACRYNSTCEYRLI